MTPETVMSIAYQAMMVTLYLGAPLLLTALLQEACRLKLQWALQLCADVDWVLQFPAASVVGVKKVVQKVQLRLYRRLRLDVGDRHGTGLRPS